MSQKSGKNLPPFIQLSGKKPLNPAALSTSRAPPSAQQSQDPPLISIPTEERAQGSPVQSPLKRTKRDAPKDGATPPASKTQVTATRTQHLFASLGTKYAGEAEPSGWWKAEPEENATALTKCLAEAFIRQAAHTKSYKNLSSSHAQLEKKVRVLEFQKMEDKRSLQETFKLDLQRETASLRTELENVAKERDGLGRSLKETQQLLKETVKQSEEAVAKLNGELEVAKAEKEAAKAEKETAFQDGLEKGTVTFMKEFVRKIPDFDWERLGPGNAEYAESLRLEIAAEDAEEARLAEEAKRATPEDTAS